MPNYLSPGVYVEEVEAGSRPIEGVGTAVAAFVGLAARGPANTPTLVTNWSQFTSTFGEFMESSYLAHAVYGYFLNGGGAAYVVRVGADGVMPTAQRRAREREGQGQAARSASPPSRPARTATTSRSTSSPPRRPPRARFKLVVKQGGKAIEVFDNVTTGKGKQNVATVVKAQSKTITIEEVGRSASARPGAGLDRPRRRRRRAPRRASRPTTTSATRPTAPASPASRPSTRSRCWPCPT